MAWQEVANDKRERINANIPSKWRLKSKPSDVSVMGFTGTGIMSFEEVSITNSSATDLVAKMANGGLTSVVVTTAFCKRAAIAHQLVSHHHIQ